MDLPASPFSFLLVGAGRVGTAVSFLLRASAHRPVGVASRTPASVERATKILDSRAVDLDPAAWPASDVVLIATSDDAIESVATAAAHALSGRVVVHFAGSLGIRPLRAAVEAGAVGCALHPVQACPDVETAIARLPGSAWGVTCSGRDAERWASDVIEHDLQGHPRAVPEEGRPIWHAAAVTASNGLAAVLSTGEALLEEIGVASPIEVLGPLAAGTLDNAREGGGGAPTVTGPVVRGEAGTVVRHAESIARHAPAMLEEYRLVARTILAAARRAGRVDPGRAAEVEAALEP